MSQYINMLHNKTQCSVWLTLKEERKKDLVPHILGWLPKDHWLEISIKNGPIFHNTYTNQALIWGIAPEQAFQMRISWALYYMKSKKDILFEMKRFNYDLLTKEEMDYNEAIARWQYRMNIIKGENY